MANTPDSSLPKRVKDIRGERFGRLIITAYAGTNKFRASKWMALCDCGKTVQVGSVSLKNDKTKSCGCLYADSRATSAATHRGCYEPEYTCWKAMMVRCYNPKNKSYFRYGGAGVTVQANWHGLGYRIFRNHIGPRPSPLHTIDRFPDKAGNYVESNVRWATKKEQQRNMKSNRLLTFEDRTLTMAEWTEIKGWHRSKLKGRKYAGWTDERALSTP